MADRGGGRTPGGLDHDLARYVRTTDGFMTWRGLPDAVGHLRRGGADRGPEREVGRGPDEPGAEDRHPRRGGRTWTKYERDTKVQNSLLDDPETSGDLTTLVTGTASLRGDGRLRDVPEASRRALAAPGRMPVSLLSAVMRASALSSQRAQCAASASPRTHRPMLSSSPTWPLSRRATMSTSSSRACS